MKSDCLSCTNLTLCVHIYFGASLNSTLYHVEYILIQVIEIGKRYFGVVFRFAIVVNSLVNVLFENYRFGVGGRICSYRLRFMCQSRVLEQCDLWYQYTKCIDRSFFICCTMTIYYICIIFIFVKISEIQIFTNRSFVEGNLRYWFVRWTLGVNAKYHIK